MKAIFAKYPDLMVCSSCFQIYGFCDYISPRLECWRHWQKCDCSDKAGMPEDVDEKWPWKDFNKLVELCYCCGKVLIPSGSRWNYFFCDECRLMVFEFNWRYGRLIIPVGRHSIVNGVSLSNPPSVANGWKLSGQEAQNDGKVEQFVSNVNGMVASIKHLEQWSRLEVANQLREMGRSDDVPLAYEYRFFSINRDKSETFGRLVDFFGGV